MELRLERKSFTDTATEGELYIDGKFECYTLEDCDRNLESGGTKAHGITAIPRGKYTVQLSFSGRFNKPLPILLDVPQFTGVRIHSGNSSADTEGCILVGSQNASESDDFIGNSRLAFEPLFEKIQTALRMNEPVTIEVV